MNKASILLIILYTVSVSSLAATVTKKGSNLTTFKKANLVKALKWKTLPTNERITFKFCDTPGFTIATTGGGGEISISQFSVREKDRRDSDTNYSTVAYPKSVTNNWKHRKISAQYGRSTPQTNMSTPANKAASDTRFTIRQKRSKKPKIQLGSFGASIGNVKGKMTITAKDGRNNTIKSEIYYEYVLDRNLMKLNSPTVEQTNNRRYQNGSKTGQRTYKVFFKANYNRGCSGRVDDRLVRVRLVDPNGEVVRMNDGGMMAEFVPKLGNYTATIYAGNTYTSNSLRFKVLN